MFYIRSATINDASLLSSINTQVWKAAYGEILSKEYLELLYDDKRCTHFKQILSDYSNHINLIYSEGKCVGYVFWNIQNGTGEIKELYILKAFWSQEYGSRLFKNVIQQFKRYKVTNYFIWVFEENIKAINFYRKFGCLCSQKRKVIVVGGTECVIVEMVGKV